MGDDLIVLETTKYVDAMLKRVQNECVKCYNKREGELQPSQTKLLKNMLQRFYCSIEAKVRASIATGPSTLQDIGESGNEEMTQMMREIAEKRQQALDNNAKIISKRQQILDLSKEKEIDIETFKEFESKLLFSSEIEDIEGSVNETIVTDLKTMMDTLKSDLENVKEHLIPEEKQSIVNLQTFVQQLSGMGPHSAALESALAELNDLDPIFKSNANPFDLQQESHSASMQTRKNLFKKMKK